MCMKDLFNGIGVVIDDEINDQKANIREIVKQIESEKISVLECEELPNIEDADIFGIFHSYY